MPTFYISAVDEYGHCYDAQSFDSVEDTLGAIERLEGALEDVTVSQSYAINDAINQLKDQLADCKESPD